MHALRTSDGNVTSDHLEMKRLAVDFYAKESQMNFLNNLLVLEEGNVKKTLIRLLRKLQK